MSPNVNLESDELTQHGKPAAYNDTLQSFLGGGGQLDTTCETSPIPPLNITPPPGFCSNPWPVFAGDRNDWAMTIYQASSGAWVFNAATNQWSWGLDDYATGLNRDKWESDKASSLDEKGRGENDDDDVNNGPAFRIQCGYPWFHPGLVSCRNPEIEQITRNVLNKFIGH